MKSIHVVYGSAHPQAAVRAHKLAVVERDAFVHEIERTEDIRLVLASHYERCIAVLSAGDEDNARDQLQRMAAAVHADLCAVTFEQAPLHN
jgi:hypothetical protein